MRRGIAVFASYCGLLASLASVSAFADRGPAMAPAEPMPTLPAPAKSVTKKSKKATKVSSRKKAAKGMRMAKRAVEPTVQFSTSEIGDDDIQVFDETTDFSGLLAKRATLARGPASISPVARVIAVRRELGVNDAEANAAAQDIILNGGTATGINEGMTLAVVRKIPVLDPYHENRQTELEIEFAKVKVVHAQSDLAVARVEEIEKISEGMAVGTRAVLVGDFITRPTK